jgi:uncharacterized Fe-S radical SAM superfamily protein PflX
LLRIPVLLRASVPKLFSECRMEIVFEQNIPITAALDATDSNVREVQQLSRHRNLETLTRYDNNRQGHQRKVSELLSKLV